MDQKLLTAALEGLLAQRARIDEQIERVRAMLAVPETPKQERLTDGGRERIAEAQRKRWAEFRKRGAA